MASDVKMRKLMKINKKLRAKNGNYKLDLESRIEPKEFRILQLRTTCLYNELRKCKKELKRANLAAPSKTGGGRGVGRVLSY